MSRLIATFFGIGLIPYAPGTMGSLAALPFAWLLAQHFGNLALLLASALAFVVGVAASDAYVKHTGREDPKEVVIDEVAGQWFLLSVMPLSVKSYLIAFLLFRLFDILKPFPVNRLDRNVKGGLGIMLDDMVAGAYPLCLFMLFGMAANLAGNPVNLDVIYEWLMKDVF